MAELLGVGAEWLRYGESGGSLTGAYQVRGAGQPVDYELAQQ